METWLLICPRQPERRDALVDLQIQPGWAWLRRHMWKECKLTLWTFKGQPNTLHSPKCSTALGLQTEEPCQGLPPPFLQLLPKAALREAVGFFLFFCRVSAGFLPGRFFCLIFTLNPALSSFPGPVKPLGRGGGRWCPTMTSCDLRQHPE